MFFIPSSSSACSTVLFFPWMIIFQTLEYRSLVWWLYSPQIDTTIISAFRLSPLAVDFKRGLPAENKPHSQPHAAHLYIAFNGTSEDQNKSNSKVEKHQQVLTFCFYFIYIPLVLAWQYTWNSFEQRSLNTEDLLQPAKKKPVFCLMLMSR